MGHQAAQCTNSSINWKGLYGENAFKVKGVLFPSEIYAMEEAKKVDQKDLLERATAYAKVRSAAEYAAPAWYTQVCCAAWSDLPAPADASDLTMAHVAEIWCRAVPIFDQTSCYAVHLSAARCSQLLPRGVIASTTES